MKQQWEALIVGIDEYPIFTTLHNLTVARKDAEDVAQTLNDYGYESFRIQSLPQQPHQKREDPNQVKLGVRLEELQDKITHLFNPPSRQETPDLALFFFSGHGWHQVVDGNDDVFLATSDVFPKGEIYGISLGWLGEEIEKSSVKKVIVWLDCCFSGELIKYVPTNKDYCFITGTRCFETGLEISYSQGLFTKTLLEGLNPDNYADGIVDSNKLKEFIEKQMEKTPQRPLIKNSQRSIILTTRYSSQKFRDECPYRSLSYFRDTPEDATFFWGRSKLTNNLIARIQNSRFIGVFGSSGSGKSSLLRAGLLYQLKLGQAIAGSNSWTYLTPFTPTENPLKQLNDVWLAPSLNPPKEVSENSEVGISKEKPIIMIIDQFEECFTMCDETICQTFFEGLIELLEQQLNLQIIIGMRSDFRGRLREYTELVNKIEKPYINVEHLNREEIEEVIKKPADLVGLQIQGSLQQQLINDVEDYPGSLPLLEYTLTQLWQETRKQGERFLTLKTYQELGGIEGTLEKRADEVFNRLDENEQAIAQRIFLELTQIGDTFDTRRRVYLHELINSHHTLEQLDQVTQKLADETNRLIVRTQKETLGEGKSKQPTTKNSLSTILIDVIHEALIRNWRMLRQWQDDYQEGMVIERKIEAAAKEWKRQQEKPEYLLQGSKLGEAQEYIKNYGNLGMLDGIAETYIEGSIRHKTFNSRRNGSVAIGVMLGLSAGLIFSLIGYRNTLIEGAITSRNSAENSLRLNHSLDGMIHSLQAAKAIKDPLVQTPLLQPFSSTQTQRLQELQDQITQTLQWAVYRVKETNRLRGHSSVIVRSIVSHRSNHPDEQFIASAGEDGYIKLWDFKGRLFKSWKGDEQRIWNVAFRPPDNQLLASSGENGKVRIWSLQQIRNLPGTEIEELPTYQEISAHQGYVRYVSFSPDGDKLASVGGEDGQICLWDLHLSDQKLCWEVDERFAKTVDFHPHNALMVTMGMDKKVKIWDSQGKSKEPLQTLDFVGWGAFFSPNGKYIAAAGNDGSIKLWQSQEGLVKPQWLEEQQWLAHKGRIWNIAFSLDSQQIASGGEDGSVRIWDLKGQQLAEFQGHTGPIRSVKFIADQYLISSGDDGTTRLWNLDKPPYSDSSQDIQRKFDEIIVNPDHEELLAINSKDGIIQLRDVSQRQPIEIIKQYTVLQVHDLTVSSNGELVASAGAEKDNQIDVWSQKTGKKINTFQDHVGKVLKINFSLDSQRLVSAGEDNTIRVWENVDKKEQGKYSWIFQVQKEDNPEIKSEITSLKFSPDGQKIITGNNLGYIGFWDLEQSRQTAIWKAHRYPIKDIRFSSDGKTLYTEDHEGTLNWPIQSFDELVKIGCQQIASFLKNNPDQNIGESYRSSCNIF